MARVQIANMNALQIVSRTTTWTRNARAWQDRHEVRCGDVEMDPSASNMAIDIQNLIIEPKHSCSKEPMSNDGEPTIVLQNFLGLESIFDTPRKVTAYITSQDNTGMQT
ncbi:unnamed protein product [Parnassius apollo]|uniref:(apollo) hypothetical protein n=1 Tax=Parnassius apollo TaxID=110799 RepID=A0A8S3W3I7_PARAO|nr:unnamed protein product [Parnassius apollo]